MWACEGAGRGGNVDGLSQKGHGVRESAWSGVWGGGGGVGWGVCVGGVAMGRTPYLYRAKQRVHVLVHVYVHVLVHGLGPLLPTE